MAAAQDATSPASNNWLDKLLATGLGVANLFAPKQAAAPSGQSPAPAKSTNWLPWIIGGAAVLALVVIFRPGKG